MGESIVGSIQRMKPSVRSERMNNVIYLSGTVLLMLGFIAQLLSQQMSGLVLVAAGFFVIAIVSVHGLVTKIEFDIFVGVVQLIGLLLSSLSILSIAYQISAGTIQGKNSFIWLGVLGALILLFAGMMKVWRGFKCTEDPLKDSLINSSSSSI